MRVVFRRQAADDLDRIHAWIAKDRPAVADSVILRIIESTDLLRQFPYIGQAGAVPQTQEWVVPGLPYIIVYTVDASRDEIAILGVFHGAQDHRRP